MLSKLKILIRFIRFYFSAKTRYQIHSPFAFEFVESVVEDRRHFYAFNQIEVLRKSLLNNHNKIKVTDLGAGSLVNKNAYRSIHSIARTALSPRQKCRQLFRIVQLYKPATLLELGTSLGISTLYQALAATKSKVITMEGCRETAAIAAAAFKAFGASNIELRIGPFDENLETVLADNPRLDYVFIDGNHQKEATLRYFKKCLEKSHAQTVILIDDIYWSAEMEAAWKTIKEDEATQVTIDLFFFGIVFLSKSLREKEHFRIIPSRWKPWGAGFFSS